MEIQPKIAPGAVYGGGGAIGAGVLSAAFLKGQGRWLFIGILVGLLVLLLGGYLLFTWWRRRRQSRQLTGEIQQHGAAAPRGISDPAQRARLDDLRKKFDEGIQAYRTRGKDLHSLPWYVIVGEPGSGKTEAVRHSQIPWPSGMQDVEYQGVGGTINMNWWFANHAVLLDTAGRLMFEEVKPGESSEWKEFLNLLGRTRPNCPVNGLFLVIPSDSLIKDTAETIQKKAGKIAQQLDVIQRTLDVRFPVFVVITKCDKILGFREFFDGLTDPHLQHQMLGWSNPDPLDSPFRPDLVDQHLENVAQRLRRRRLGLLRDPVPQSDDSGGRRADEVDTLYALPNSLGALAPCLRRYLETIFVAGEWSAKPLFLRGIYFSSSLREGAALDQDLAEAMGVPVDSLADFRVWERDRSYFLRDVFLEKAFKEQGLVTRATNTEAVLRRRRLTLYGGVSVALIGFLTAAWYGMNRLKDSGVELSPVWQAVAETGWDREVWKASLIPLNPATGLYEYKTNAVALPLADGRTLGLADFHALLSDRTTNQITGSWLFPALVKDYQKASRNAQRIVFEGGVVKPLIEAARQRLRSESEIAPDGLVRQAAALASLVQLEAAILSRTNLRVLTETEAQAFADPLLQFVTADPQASLPPKLATLWSWLYTRSEAAQRTWPPAWLSGQKTRGEFNLANYPDLEAGVRNLSRNLAQNLERQRTGGWVPLTGLRTLLTSHVELEQELLRASQSGPLPVLTNAYARLEASRQRIDAYLSTNEAWLRGGSLTGALAGLKVEFDTVTARAVQPVLTNAASAQAEHQGRPETNLFVDIERELANTLRSLAVDVGTLERTANPEELQRLDQAQLAHFGDEPAYRVRLGFYRQFENLLREDTFSGRDLIGLRGESLTNFLAARLAPLTRQAQTYTGGGRDLFIPLATHYATWVRQAQADFFLRAYASQAAAALEALSRYPLVRGSKNVLTRDELVSAKETLKFIGGDLASPVLVEFGLAGQESVKALASQVSRLTEIVQALVPDRGVATVELQLLQHDAANPVDAWRNVLRELKLGEDQARFERTQLAGDRSLGTPPLDQPLVLFLRRPDDPPERWVANRVPNWGPLRLLHQADGARRDPNDATSWLVNWPLASNTLGVTGDIRLRLRFKATLPELERWPAIAAPGPRLP